MARPNKNPNNIRIVAIDPSTTAMGISVLDYDKSLMKTTLQRSLTLYGAKLLKDPELLKLSILFNKQFSTLTGIHLYLLNNIFRVYKPQYIVVESAFCHRAFINAFASLTLTIHEIKRAAMLYYNKDIYLVAPKVVKKEISLNHEASKDDMKDAILHRKDLNITINEKYIDINKMTQHEFDSASHGLCFIRLMLPSILLVNDIVQNTKIKVNI